MLPYVKEDGTKMTVISKVESHGLSSLILGVKPTNYNNSHNLFRTYQTVSDNIAYNQIEFKTI